MYVEAYNVIRQALTRDERGRGQELTPQKKEIWTRTWSRDTQENSRTSETSLEGPSRDRSLVGRWLRVAAVQARLAALLGLAERVIDLVAQIGVCPDRLDHGLLAVFGEVVLREPKAFGDRFEKAQRRRALAAEDAGEVGLLKADRLGELALALAALGKQFREKFSEAHFAALSPTGHLVQFAASVYRTSHRLLTARR